MEIAENLARGRIWAKEFLQCLINALTFINLYIFLSIVIMVN